MRRHDERKEKESERREKKMKEGTVDKGENWGDIARARYGSLILDGGEEWEK